MLWTTETGGSDPTSQRQNDEAVPWRIVLLLGCAVATACLQSTREDLVLNLLPATPSGRIQAPVQLVHEARLLLELNVTARHSDTESEGGGEAWLEVWAHPATGADVLLHKERIEEGAQGMAASVDVAPRDTTVLLTATVRGIEPSDVRWSRAELRVQHNGPSWFGGYPSPPEWRPEPPRDSPNVILYVIDALRRDAVGAYGGSAPTPNLDRLADEGVRFDHAYTTSSWTRAAVGSLMSGLYPSVHGAVGYEDAFPEGIFTLAERFRLSGYETMAVTANGNVDPYWGFDQGFETYERLAGRHRLDEEGSTSRRPYALAEEIHERAMQLLKERGDRDTSSPLFLYVHVVDPHLLYDPPVWLLEKPRSALDASIKLSVDLNMRRRDATPTLLHDFQSLYLGEVSYSDRAFGHFREAVLAMDELENTIILLTSDHGEQFYEHRSTSHGTSLYEEEIRIPLIVWGPGRVPRGAVLGQPASLVDVLPTLLSFTKRPTRKTHGVDLSFTWRVGHSERDPSRDRSLFAEIDLHGQHWRALLDGQRKLLFHRNHVGKERYLLFDLTADPGETENLFDPASPLSRRLLAELGDWMTGLRRARLSIPTSESASPSQKLIDDIRALGYVQ